MNRDQLKELYADLQEHLCQAEEARQIIRIIHGATTDRKIEDAVEAISRLLDQYGRESIQMGEEEYRTFWDNTIFCYVNTGDTYSPTIGYLPEKQEWRCTTYGDVVEEWENENSKECDHCDESGLELELYDSASVDFNTVDGDLHEELLEFKAQVCKTCANKIVSEFVLTGKEPEAI